MKTFRSVAIALVVLAAGLFQGYAEPQQTVDPYLLEQLLPEETALYAVLPNLPAVAENMKKTKLHQLTQDEEIKAFLANFAPQIAFVAGQADAKLEPFGLSFKGLIDLLRSSSFSIAVIDIPEEGKEAKDIVFAVGPRSATVDFSTVLAKTKEHLKAGNAKVADTKMEFKGKTYYQFGGAAPAKTLYHTTFGKTFVFASSKERMESLIAGSLERPASSLATSATFKTALAKSGSRGNEVYFLYANAGRLLDRMLAKAKEHEAAMAKLLGVTAVRSISLSQAPDGENFKGTLFIDTGGKKEGLVRLLSPKPAESKNLRFVPENAFFCSAANVDLKGIVNEILSLARSAEGEKFKGDAELKALNERLGISFVDDFLGSIEGDIVFFTAFPEAGGLMPDAMLIATLKDPAAFEKSFAAIVDKAAHKGFEETTYQGTTIKVAYLQPDNRKDFFGTSATLPVSYCIREKTLFLSLFPDALKREIKRLNGTGFRNITQSSKFTSIAGAKPSAGAFVYADMESIFNIFANTALPFAGLFQGVIDKKMGGIPFRIETLPLGETVGKYLGQATVSLADDADGIAVSIKMTFPLITGYAYAVLSALDQ